MTVKISHVVMAIIASTPFSPFAQNILAGSEVVAEADIIVTKDSPLGLSITPETNLTVADIRKGALTTIAKFRVSGSSGGNAAVRLLNSTPGYPYCAYILGSSDSNNKFEVCLGDVAENFVANNNTYYKYSDGEYIVRGGGDNRYPNLTPVAPDSYKMAMELVRYTK
ncbi:hypothetical protein ACET8I_20725 [Aeromonas veronii]